MSGTLALVGGAAWRENCTFDAGLLETSGAKEVLVLPTAAAYEHPEKIVAAAERYFEPLGATSRALMVLSRPDALEQANVDAVKEARFIYVVGGSPMHLRSVLMHSPLWDAIVDAWHAGAVLAGSSAGSMVLCDPMVDPRGGAFTLGLGLVAQMAVIPHHDLWSHEKEKRTIALAPEGLVLVGIDEQTALIRSPDGGWRVEGAGKVVVYRDGSEVGLDALPR